MKREHNLSTIHKGGFSQPQKNASYLAMALNLKRMVKAICFAIFVNEIRAESMISQPAFYFVNRSVLQRSQLQYIVEAISIIEKRISVIKKLKQLFLTIQSLQMNEIIFKS